MIHLSLWFPAYQSLSAGALPVLLPQSVRSFCYLTFSHLPVFRSLTLFFFQSLTFSLLQIVRLPGFLQFQNQNPGHFIPSSPTSSSPSSYLSLTSGEDLEGLNLLLLSIPGHCLRVQDAGNHRVLLHLQRDTEWDKITKHKNWNCGAQLFKVKGQIVIFFAQHQRIVLE